MTVHLPPGETYMPLNKYGVLKGRAVDAKREQDTQSPHYPVHIVANVEHYRIAVNVMSVKSRQNFSSLWMTALSTRLLTACPDLRMDFPRSKAHRANRHST